MSRLGTWRRAALWPTLAFIPSLIILLSLGLWQVQRLDWKEGLIGQIEQRATAAPVPIADAFARADAGEDIEYLRVALPGRFAHDGELRMFAHAQEGSGFHLITPFLLDDGGFVLVNRGYVPEPLLAAAERSPEPVTLTGLARAPEVPGLFTPDNDPAGNIWFWRDGTAMAEASASASGLDPTASAAIFVDLDRTDDGQWPRGGVTRLELPNRHLEYALTWFGMAGALTVIYLLFVRSRLTRPSDKM